MIGMDTLSAAIVERFPGSARVTTFFTRQRTKPQPAPGPIPAPPGDDILRTGPGSVELILSHAGASSRNFLVVRSRSYISPGSGSANVSGC